MSAKKKSKKLDDDREFKGMDDQPFMGLDDDPDSELSEMDEESEEFDGEVEEDILEIEEIQAKLESGEAFFTPSDESGIMPKSRIIYACPRCRRVFFNNKWVKDNFTDVFTVRTELAYCDRCLSKAVDNFVGSVEIYDKQLNDRKETIIQIAREVERSIENSPPFEKIIDIVVKKDILFIFTNTTRLAMEIGKNIRDEFHGGIQYEWFERNQYLRVKWFDEIHNKDYFKERIKALKERRFGLFTFEDEE